MRQVCNQRAPSQLRQSGRGGTLSSSAGSTSSTVASLAMISNLSRRRLSSHSPSPPSSMSRQAFNLASGQFEVGNARDEAWR
jgi:hypothetical protein